MPSANYIRPLDLRAYRERGYDFPIRVTPRAGPAALHGRFLEYIAGHSEQLQALAPRDQYAPLSETHVSLRWVYGMVSDSNVLDAVEAILGPDLLVWSSRWFSKLPGEKTFVSWHQDATYWGLHPPHVTTAWVALSDSTRENGCMRVIPGTHLDPLLPQNDTYHPDNALSRGQEIAVAVDESLAVDIVLAPGEMSMHHIGIVHGSEANTSGKPRIGLAVRYITPDVRQDGVDRPTGMLVRGRDRFGNFELLDPPESDVDSRAAALQQAIVGKVRTSIMRK